MTQTETDLKKWQQQQARFQKIFGDQAIHDKGFQKIKLQELERIYQKNKGSANPVEQATLQWLRAGNRGLERMLYPGFGQLGLRRLTRFTKRIVAGKPKKVKVKTTQQTSASRNWMQQHVHNTDNNIHRPATKATGKSISKEPRVRLPESAKNSVHVSPK